MTVQQATSMLRTAASVQNVLCALPESRRQDASSALAELVKPCGACITLGQLVVRTDATGSPERQAASGSKPAC